MMLKRVNDDRDLSAAKRIIGEASFPSPFRSGLEYASPARGTWNIVHVGMLIPEAHEIFVCAASCLRGVVLTAAECGMEDRFSTVEIKENNLLDGDLEDLIVDGVSDIIKKLKKRPPAILVYTSCVHHFAGCDLDMVYQRLRQMHPDIDFTDCYMNPIMRKSGLTPDQLMRSRLYTLLKPNNIDENTVSIIGNDFSTDDESQLVKMIRSAGKNLMEITRCSTYEEYQDMAKSSLYISYYPPAKAGGDMLEERLGGRHIFLPFALSYDEIEKNLKELAGVLSCPLPDFALLRQKCEKALEHAKQIIGDTPIAIDYTALPRPLALARLLLEHGFNVQRVYADTFIPLEKADFEYLKENHPELELYPTVHSSMRFMAEKENNSILAIGQKAAHFCGTNRFVNIVEGGGMYDFEAIEKLCALMIDAYENEKDMRNLIQIKGMGCGCI